MESWLYPSPAVRRERDPIQLAQYVDLTGLEVYLDCGEGDHFKDGAAKLHEVLQTRGIPSRFDLTPGGHDVARLLAHLENYVLFLAGE